MQTVITVPIGMKIQYGHQDPITFYFDQLAFVTLPGCKKKKNVLVQKLPANLRILKN